VLTQYESVTLRILQGEAIPGKHTCKLYYFTKIPTKKSTTIFLLLVCWIFIQTGQAWSQQSKREYIYLDGKLVAVETASTTPLTVTISSPTSSTSYNTNSSPINLSGSLSGNVGVTQVTWSNNRGGSGNCSGTTSWTCSGIALQIGQNILTVSASDELSNIGSDILTVTYCNATLTPPSTSKPASGGTGNVDVSINSNCSWTSNSNNPEWITVTGDGTGSGTANYTVDPNTGPARDGAVTIAAKTFTVSQANGCTYSISPTSAYFEADGGTGSVSVTSGTGCAWTATSNNPGWITVSGDGSAPASMSITVLVHSPSAGCDGSL